jgi:hypothetical protein
MVMAPLFESLIRTGRPAAPTARTAPAAAPSTVSARRGGESQDRALYRCGCGYAFKAKVSTSVGCPHCGTRQAW